MLRRLVNACRDVDFSMNDSNRHSTHAQKAILDMFCNKPVTLAESLQAFFLREFLTLFYSADVAACDAVIFLQGYVSHFSSTVRDHLDRLAGQGGAQVGPTNSQSSARPRSVDPKVGS